MIAPAALAATLLLALGSSGCCRIIAALDDVREEKDPAPTAPASELGLAAYPAGTPASRATTHAWFARRMKPDTYRLQYALSPAEADAVAADLQGFARKVGYESDGKDRFRWRPPAGCAGGMACVYQSLAARSVADVAPIAARFRARAREANLSSLDVTQLVVTFVQAIPYEIPEKEPFGLLPPALVASKRKGDCDSKSLLAHLILRELGVESVMVGSSAHKHGMLGIALPVPGTKIRHLGRDYAFTEMTAKGSPIGHINPRLLSPNDWKAQPFDVPRAAAGKPATPSRPEAPAKPGPAKRRR